MKDLGKVGVVGAGAWGTALALVAARAGSRVALWGRDEKIVSEIATRGTNERYLPGVNLDMPIDASACLDETLAGARIVLLVVPAQSLSTVAPRIAGLVEPGATLVCCSKGIDRQTGLLPCETVSRLVKPNPVAALSGPSFAADVARELPTAVTVAASRSDDAEMLAARLSSAQFRCYASDDLKGVELGGALKNVIALGVGAVRGMELGASAEAALIARGFAELVRLSVSLGARAETLSGLSGLGDLVLTCSSVQSRNFSYGLALGRGDSVDGLRLAEGAFTASIAADLAKRTGVDTPIIDAVAAVLSKRIEPREAVRQLLARPLKREDR